MPTRSDISRGEQAMKIEQPSQHRQEMSKIAMLWYICIMFEKRIQWQGLRYGIIARRIL